MGTPMVAVIGYTGGVGSCLVQAMERIGLDPWALVRSSEMRLGCGAEGSGEGLSVDYDLLGARLAEAAKAAGAVPVIADVTASTTPQAHYRGWLRLGISVVAANKYIFAGDEETYKGLLEAAAADPPSLLLHETTCGAGLPVLSTLGSLRAASHTIERVEGVLSGTLAFIFGAVAGGKMTLSAAVAEARALGYTEPDPRQDLNGMDVARKAVILARTSGMSGVELDSLTVESLVPAELRDCSVEEFLAGLSEFDEDFAKRIALVEAEGGRMHYAATVDAVAKTVEVGLRAVKGGHPFNSAGPDNILAITTNFYPRPICIQGAGAGGDVTATGVLADILQCARRL